MNEWYYEQDGTHVGPVSEADLNVLLANRLIDAGTRVWTSSFGQQWKHAHETELQMPRPTTPPPLPPPINPMAQASPSAGPAPVATGQAVLAQPGAVTEKWANVAGLRSTNLAGRRDRVRSRWL
ncbi:DUF4339 domain-containing protein [Mesorhizobium sp. ESP6-5]|uniref:DUF4339 domain-containing protein n=1 Tax=Mesorhizobium sp. ESP6-5 TaxID=2876623 RepID=UPI001CCF428A|nr:DUF4339 domain-containing protein [Mesorhizobium sp. ESP6-5]